MNRIYVWDRFVRIFHWSLLAAFILCYITEGEYQVHFYSGYLITALILSRAIWGLVGTKYARFSDFVYAPRLALAYLQNLFHSDESEKKLSKRLRQSKHYLGHNPAGGLMVIALMISILLTCVSGMAVYGSQGYGPFADAFETPARTSTSMDKNKAFLKTDKKDELDIKDEMEELHMEKETVESNKNKESKESKEREEFLEEIHEFFVNLTLLLVFVHIFGVALSSFKQNENLVQSMITGYKNNTKE
ncbi:cytochrome b/b6 domain-containing protein [Aliikangiella sp. G2MR2-5]|uniref:cytochrome b/b6 domain-containing protein n=1 Tax=Aliikangiella sp. G2MR2-5 TaxID=2788943 RepID=UPI0018AA4FAD|nr:cytochrome b/b6 domain-containing protein [Aliikangiella sp. G2MR2-5]